MRAFARAIGDTFAFLGRILRAFFSLIWGFMVIFSFIVNVILVAVLLILGVLIFNIKNDVADPLLKSLHSSFVGLDQATIDWTIPVRDSVNAQFILPLQQNTNVVLTQDVPITVTANISGPVSIVGATVALTLPAGTILPVALDLEVPVDEVIPVELDVRAVIPLSETQLHDPFENLRLTFEPIILALDNLPNNFGETLPFVGDLLAPPPPDLFDTAGSQYLQSPWTGFSRTAGIGYTLLDESRTLNQNGNPTQAQSIGSPGNPYVLQTGLTVLGGIPALDAIIRPELYENDNTPAQNIAVTREQLEALGLPPASYAGGFANLSVPSEGAASTVDPNTPPTTIGDPAATPIPVEPLLAGTPQPIFTPQPGN
ncbi:MAG: hypothetical protein ACOYL5_03990 [Phototrophicaceae bacterium]